jgi:hypothetical protein
MEMTDITTNRIPRDLLTVEDLPAAAQKNFDYVEGDDRLDPRIVMYRGRYYDVFDFENTCWSVLEGWDGAKGDSFYSGVVVKFTDDGQVIMGTYYS